MPEKLSVNVRGEIAQEALERGSSDYPFQGGMTVDGAGRGADCERWRGEVTPDINSAFVRCPALFANQYLSFSGA